MVYIKKKESNILLLLILVFISLKYKFKISIFLGGGTLDISVLWINGGLFITQALAGNNRLGGQDFNNNILEMFKKNISQITKLEFDNHEDLQQLRLAIEKAKIQLSRFPEIWIKLQFRSSKLKFEYLVQFFLIKFKNSI